MVELEHVKAKNFYQRDSEKTKLNWFCYEYANNIYISIRASKNLARYRGRHKHEDIAAFCLYFAKRVREVVLERLTTRSDIVIFERATKKPESGAGTGAVAAEVEYVYGFYPKCPPKQAEALLEAAMRAWREQLKTCRNCPSQCLRDWLSLCVMFDSLARVKLMG
jgi:hypothetical protein